MFDAAGRRAAILVNGWREAGTYHVIWPRHVKPGPAAGIHFLRLSVAGSSFPSIRKLLVLD